MWADARSAVPADDVLELLAGYASDFVLWLNADEPLVRAYTACILANIAFLEPGQQKVLTAGGVAPLMRLLKQKKEDTKVTLHSTAAIQNLTYKNTACCSEVLDNGGEKVLKGLLSVRFGRGKGCELRERAPHAPSVLPPAARLAWTATRATPEPPRAVALSHRAALSRRPRTGVRRLGAGMRLGAWGVCLVHGVRWAHGRARVRCPWAWTARARARGPHVWLVASSCACAAQEGGCAAVCGGRAGQLAAV
jgi:hypothetical protein